MKTKKQRLLPAKEARALVEKQRDQLAKAGLEIVRLKNEVESLEGARRNLKMMYDVHEEEKRKAVHEKIDAQASVKALGREVDRLSDVIIQERQVISAYDNEPAVMMWVRSMRKATFPVRRAVSSFFARFKRKK